MVLLVGGILTLNTVKANTPSDTRPYVVTTTAQVHDIVREIGGVDIRSEHLMGAGIDPHLYRPTRSDIAKLTRADIVVYNGLHLEGQMTELLSTLAREKPVIAISDNLPADNLLHDAQTAGHDPHIWMNVKNWIAASDVVTDVLRDALPEKTNNISIRASEYTQKLATLDAGIRDAIATIPPTARTLVTAHDAFGYLGAVYGLDVIGIQGLSTESEAGLKRMRDLATLIQARKIPTIFTETSVSEKNIDALIARAKTDTHTVTRAAALYSDAMGTGGTYESTYIGMMEHNIRTITAALGGTKTAFLNNSPRIAMVQ